MFTTFKFTTMKNFKTTLILIGGMLSLCYSCSVISPIGQLNSVSTRNIDSSKEYELKEKTTISTSKEKRKNSSANLQVAVTKTVLKNQDGEYLMNAFVYLVYTDYFFFHTIKYSVEGDIWGVKK